MIRSFLLDDGRGYFQLSQSDVMKTRDQHNDQKIGVFLIPGFIISSFFSGCYTLKMPPPSFSGVVREKDSGALLSDVRVDLQKTGVGTTYVPTGWSTTTGAVGYFELPLAKLLTYGTKSDLLNNTFQLVFSKPGLPPQSVYISQYVGYTDVLMDDPAVLPDASERFKVADMHYHLTMRAQNAMGPHLYDGNMNTNGDVSHVLWYKSIRGLMVPRKGRWHKPHKLTHTRLVRANQPNEKPSSKRRISEVQYLLEGTAVHAPRGNNGMRHYSQATLPNTEQGQVFLGFNAISPFEQNLNNSGTKRFISKKLKTGIEQSWLARLGNKKNCPPLITHWENFKKEYEMFAAHDLSYNALDWRHLAKGSDLNTDTQPSMVAVLEGGHVLQHLIFPNDVSYDLEHRTRTEEKTLVERLLDPQVSRPTYGRTHSPEVQAMLAKLGPAHAAFMALDYLPRPRPATWASDLRGAENLERSLVDELLLLDLRQRVAELKHLKGPPVKMVVVSHLSYNGMTGHAPALDDGGFLSAILAQKVYNIRVSEDRSYLRQWRGLFFTVPGVNKFGSALMRELLNTHNGEPRILIDLKHSDLLTRHFFYDSLMTCTDTVTIPPICSHCAVTGLPEDFYSPFTNEYRVLRAPFTTTFYPFGINLYDEEIQRIHRNHGIIGITLEQRVLGGYINKRSEWPLPLTVHGNVPRNKVKANHRRNLIRRYTRYIRYVADPVVAPPLPVGAVVLYSASSMNHAKAALQEAMLYSQRKLNVVDDGPWTKSTTPEAHWDRTVVNLNQKPDRGDRDDRRILRATTADYISAEPFLQNLFHIIDLIKADTVICCAEYMQDKGYAWRHVCIGSDLDGLIDPIDICPTADMYPYFNDRLRQFIPLFLQFRKDEYDLASSNGKEPNALGDYFDDGFTVDDALNQLFYESLRQFSIKNF